MCSDGDIVLSVRNVSKCFEMYEKPVHRLYQTLCAGKKKFYREFWALRDINFDVRRGECVGIIGRNGAGKSTLLQIITGTLAATTGTVELKGRVAALLELGSGFNPEFTGRENVYLNGSILGLSRKEIDERYDDIVAFADIGDFMDQPVKTYSSGMMIRLAFAVQVMVEPDVLIVDEALAVGDAAFQRKCYSRMEQMLARGTTLFLVTHDTEAVKRFCRTVVFLKDGKVDFIGPAADGVVRYFQYLFPNENPEPAGMAQKPGTPEAKPGGAAYAAGHAEYIYEKVYFDPKSSWGNRAGRIKWVRIHGVKEPNLLVTPQHLKMEICIELSAERVVRLVEENHLDRNIIVGYKLSNKQNVTVYGTNTLLEGFPIDLGMKDGQVVVVDVDLPELAPDDYFLTFAVQMASGTKNPAYVDLEWDDVCIQLRNEVDGFVGQIGFVKLPSAFALRRDMEDHA